jgi:hypothetical protein
MSYTGKVQNGVVVLVPEANLPDGTEVEVTPLVTSQQAEDFTNRLVRIAEQVRGLPPDLARNHDHYLHGHPKQ